MSVRRGWSAMRKPSRTAGKRAAGKLKGAVKAARTSSYNQARRIPYGGIIGRAPVTRGATTFGAEVKTVDVPGNIAAAGDVLTKPISTTYTIDLLNGIQEGASFYNRVGRRVRNKSLHVTGVIEQNPANNATVTAVPEYLRVLVIYDRESAVAGTFPAVTEILQDTDNAGNNVTTSLSKMNLNNVERFAILRDHRIQIPNNNSSGANENIGSQSIMNYGQQANINDFIPLKDLETHYKGSTNPSALADIATGAFYLMTLGNVAAATAGFQLQYNSRLRYTDV